MCDGSTPGHYDVIIRDVSKFTSVVDEQTPGNDDDTMIINTRPYALGLKINSGTKVCTAETPQAEERNLMIKIIMIRVEAEDYDAWLKTHYDHVEDRHSYGMTDGPVYRDIDNSNAALFHIHVENLDRAMQWFRTDTFKEATKRATVVGRDFYLAEKQQPRPQA